MWDTTALSSQLLRLDASLEGQPVRVRGIPHLAKNERDAPNFLYATLDKTACAPFFKERRMKCGEPTKLHRKSGMWGTRRFLVRTEFGDGVPIPFY
jgi:hypothetical protein